MIRKTTNDVILSEYFFKKTTTSSTIPTIQEISNETGVSIATISRFAKKKGYYNFGELRASYNKVKKKDVFVEERLQFNRLFDYKKIHLVSSKSTSMIKHFIATRLEHIGIEPVVVDDETTWQGDDLTIISTITGESERIKEAIKKIKGNVIVIATEEVEGLEDSRQIILDEFKLNSRNHVDVINSVVGMINWLNESINSYELSDDKKALMK